MNCYDSVDSTKMPEPKHTSNVVLDGIDLLNDISELVEVVGWLDYMNWDKLIYERLCWEFLSSLKVN